MPILVDNTLKTETTPPALHDPRWQLCSVTPPKNTDLPFWSFVAASSVPFCRHKELGEGVLGSFRVWAPGVKWISEKVARTPMLIPRAISCVFSEGPEAPCWILDSASGPDGSSSPRWVYFTHSPSSCLHCDYTHWLPGDAANRPPDLVPVASGWGVDGGVFPHSAGDCSLKQDTEVKEEGLLDVEFNADGTQVIPAGYRELRQKEVILQSDLQSNSCKEASLQEQSGKKWTTRFGCSAILVGDEYDVHNTTIRKLAGRRSSRPGWSALREHDEYRIGDGVLLFDGEGPVLERQFGEPLPVSAARVKYPFAKDATFVRRAEKEIPVVYDAVTGNAKIPCGFRELQLREVIWDTDLYLHPVKTTWQRRDDAFVGRPYNAGSQRHCTTIRRLSVAEATQAAVATMTFLDKFEDELFVEGNVLYRSLGKAEVIEEGDEFRSTVSRSFSSCSKASIGKTVEGAQARFSQGSKPWAFRRPISAGIGVASGNEELKARDKEIEYLTIRVKNLCEGEAELQRRLNAKHDELTAEAAGRVFAERGCVEAQRECAKARQQEKQAVQLWECASTNHTDAIAKLADMRRHVTALESELQHIKTDILPKAQELARAGLALRHVRNIDHSITSTHGWKQADRFLRALGDCLIS